MFSHYSLTSQIFLTQSLPPIGRLSFLALLSPKSKFTLHYLVLEVQMHESTYVCVCIYS